MTPLLVAAHQGPIEVVKSLLAHGATPGGGKSADHTLLLSLSITAHFPVVFFGSVPILSFPQTMST